MTVNEFFELFLDELRANPALTSYYKFLASPASFEFRKAYVVQRLHYILEHLPNKEAALWDCGCGYGTTAIFLALNGYKVHGTTLEFYFAQIPERLRYWAQFGDVSGFTYSYENLFDSPRPPRPTTTSLSRTRCTTWSRCRKPCAFSAKPCAPAAT
ncbi:SAM-dependent methyltransferase [Hymenobacter sp. BRD67]|uniref:SAM-dependent methyltransferase n=1 Tax=Hymenobacter sp. BRD67 TaxID=2675877 RepID=UPI0015666888|nr:hypothetical protein [Hymenobacter sp. BRD67]QKG52451.1 hypothetical protein GKZ67_07340 [Hymenobacter sp. BRD67]